MNYQTPQLRSKLAAEYVLGTLEGHARRRFERLLQADFTLRREVQQWQNELYPSLLEALPDRRPPTRVWKAIANQTKPKTAKPSGTRWQDSLALWRSWSMLATAMAMLLAVFLGLDLLRSPPTTPWDYLAILNDSTDQPAWLVQADRASQQLGVKALRAQSIGPTNSFELWLLPGKDAVPQSLGLVPPRGETTLTLTAELTRILPEAAGLAISLEPRGGSPTGQPTGPVLYQGVLLPPA